MKDSQKAMRMMHSPFPTLKNRSIDVRGIGPRIGHAVSYRLKTLSTTFYNAGLFRKPKGSDEGYTSGIDLLDQDASSVVSAFYPCGSSST